MNYLRDSQFQILIWIILVRHTSYNVDDLKAPSSVIRPEGLILQEQEEYDEAEEEEEEEEEEQQQ
jgi:hypothetical protein